MVRQRGESSNRIWEFIEAIKQWGLLFKALAL